MKAYLSKLLHRLVDHADIPGVKDHEAVHQVLFDSVYAASGHDHAGVYSLSSHNHLGVYSLITHDHDADYEPLGTLHDGRYFQKTEFIDESGGVGDAGKPILLGSDGKMSPSIFAMGRAGVVGNFHSGGPEVAVEADQRVAILIQRAFTIDALRIVTDQSTNLQIDLWWEPNPANGPPDGTDTITNGNEPAMVSANYLFMDTFTGWTETVLTANGILTINIDANTVARYIQVQLTGEPA